jgi:hypothetical protein
MRPSVALAVVRFKPGKALRTSSMVKSSARRRHHARTRAAIDPDAIAPLSHRRHHEPASTLAICIRNSCPLAQRQRAIWSTLETSGDRSSPPLRAAAPRNGAKRALLSSAQVGHHDPFASTLWSVARQVWPSAHCQPTFASMPS